MGKGLCQEISTADHWEYGRLYRVLRLPVGKIAKIFWGGPRGTQRIEFVGPCSLVALLPAAWSLCCLAHSAPGDDLVG